MVNLPCAPSKLYIPCPTSIIIESEQRIFVPAMRRFMTETLGKEKKGLLHLRVIKLLSIAKCKLFQWNQTKRGVINYEDI